MISFYQINQFSIRLGQTIASVIRVLIGSKWFGTQNAHQKPTTSCVIIGNGPSFTTTLKLHTEYLKKNTLVCVNSFVNTEHFEVLRPQYYILNAQVFFLPDSKLSDIYITLRNDIFHALSKKVQWELTLMVPFMAKKSDTFKKLLTSNSHIRPSYYNFTPVEGFPSINHVGYRLGLGMPRVHNVLIPAIMNMIKFGYKEISIIGADHSWLSEISVTEKNEALVNQKHFYDENDSQPQKMEDYIIRPRKLHEIIHKFYLSFKSYWEIKGYAEARNVKIYNCSENSMIDAFERKLLTD